MTDFSGKVAIVTGGALGIGRAGALAFARAGAAVVVADIDDSAGPRAVADIKAGGGRGLFVHCDMGSSAGCRDAVDGAVSAFGGLDIVFNNVGIQPPESYADAVELAEELWDRIIAVNLKSRFLMAKFAIPHMRARGGGVIINTASVQGLRTRHLMWCK